MLLQAARQASRVGGGDAVEVASSTPFEDGELGKGTYRVRNIYIKSLPAWTSKIAPTNVLRIEEQTWDCYPYIKTCKLACILLSHVFVYYRESSSTLLTCTLLPAANSIHGKCHTNNPAHKSIQSKTKISLYDLMMCFWRAFYNRGSVLSLATGSRSRPTRTSFLIMGELKMYILSPAVVVLLLTVHMHKNFSTFIL